MRTSDCGDRTFGAWYYSKSRHFDKNSALSEGVVLLCVCGEHLQPSVHFMAASDFVIRRAWKMRE